MADRFFVFNMMLSKPTYAIVIAIGDTDKNPAQGHHIQISATSKKLASTAKSN
jgi:hypothetical protein